MRCPKCGSTKFKKNGKRNGNQRYKCNVCNNTGEYEMEREGYVMVQEPLVIKYIMDNMDKKYG